MNKILSKEELERIAGSWNGDEDGLVADRALEAKDILENKDVGADGQKEWLEPINEKMDRHGDNGVWTPEDIQESEDLLTQKD